MVFWWSKGAIIIIFFKKWLHHITCIWCLNLGFTIIWYLDRMSIQFEYIYLYLIQTWSKSMEHTYTKINMSYENKVKYLPWVTHTSNHARMAYSKKRWPSFSLFWTSYSRRWHTNIIVIRFGALIPRGPTADADDIDAEWFYIVWLTSSWPSFVSFGDIMEDCVVMGFIRSDQGRETGPKAKIERVAGGTSTDPC